MKRCVHGCMNGWVHRRYMDGYMDGCMHVCMVLRPGLLLSNTLLCYGRGSGCSVPPLQPWMLFPCVFTMAHLRHLIPFLPQIFLQNCRSPLSLNTEHPSSAEESTSPGVTFCQGGWKSGLKHPSLPAFKGTILRCTLCDSSEFCQQDWGPPVHSSNQLTALPA